MRTAKWTTAMGTLLPVVIESAAARAQRSHWSAGFLTTVVGRCALLSCLVKSASPTAAALAKAAASERPTVEAAVHCTKFDRASSRAAAAEQRPSIGVPMTSTSSRNLARGLGRIPDKQPCCCCPARAVHGNGLLPSPGRNQAVSCGSHSPPASRSTCPPPSKSFKVDLAASRCWT